MERQRYSAKINLRLIVGDSRYALAQVGPSHAILAEPAEIPVGNAKVEVTVDNNVTVRDVFLYDGVSVDSTRFHYF